MLSFSFTPFSVTSLLMFGATLFGYAEFNLVTILTPTAIGEVLYQTAAYFQHRAKAIAARQMFEMMSQGARKDK